MERSAIKVTEVDGSTKEELLEEALFTRYLYHLGPAYSEFFMCPSTLNPLMEILEDISFLAVP